MQVALEKIVVKSGQQLLLQDISWSDLEEILADLGEQSTLLNLTADEIIAASVASLK